MPTRKLPLSLALLLLCSPSLFAQTHSAIKNLFWQPNQLQPGSPVFFTIELNREATKVMGEFLGKDLVFFRSGKPRVWYALGGVDVETTPGAYDVTVRAAVPGRGVARTVKSAEIGEAHFRSGDVTVPENFVNPDEESKRQIAADGALKERAFAHFLATPQWSGDFIKPIDAEATDSFGMTRVLNEELTSEHRGTDFPVKEGSPVVASNSGTVVLARELFYEGNCVILDHGQHFFTIYMHLSKVLVRDGMKVRRRQRIGLSGSTGRVTGPHLHMGVRWNGAYLDPVKLFALTLPETSRVPRRASTRRTVHRR